MNAALSAGRLSRNGALAVLRAPEQLHDGERAGVEGGDPPSAAQPQRQGDARDQGRGDPRAHQRGQPGEQPQCVASIARSVVVGEQELADAKRDRAGPPDLEPPHDVLPSGPEEDPRQHDRDRQPWAHAEPT